MVSQRQKSKNLGVKLNRAKAGRFGTAFEYYIHVGLALQLQLMEELHTCRIDGGGSPYIGQVT